MPNSPAAAKTEWLLSYYSELMGYTVTKISIQHDDEDMFDAWPQIKMTHPTKPDITIEVSRDQEGNGPGFLFGLPLPTD
jgi:hypothetical protein